MHQSKLTNNIVQLQNTIKPISLGQLRLLNRTNTIKNPDTKLEVLQSRQNQKRNTNLNVCMDVEESQETALRGNRMLQQQSEHNESLSSAETALWDNTTSYQQRIIDSITDIVNDGNMESDNDKDFDTYKMATRDDQIIGVNFKIEISLDSNPKEEDVIGLMYSKVAELIKR